MTDPREPQPHDSATESTRPVMVLVKRFPRLSETFILNEVLELRRQGLPIRIVAIMDPREPVTHRSAEALIPEVIYLRDGHLSRDVWAVMKVARRRPRGTLRALAWGAGRRSRAAWRRVFEGLLLVGALGDEPVHLHAHFASTPTLIAFLANMVAGQPYSVTMHAKDLYTTPPERLRERCAPATALLTCTGANAAYYAEHVDAAARVFVFRHGVDLHRFANPRRDPVPGRILTVGRLVPKKGHLDLVQALKLLAEAGLSFTWEIIGEGPLKAELQSAIARAGLTGRVDFRGSLPQDAVIDAYASAEVFALAPRVMPDGDRDGIPNVLIEAMAAGVALVATCVSGVPEVVHDEETGLLAPPGDAPALAARLRRLLTDPDLRDRLGSAGRAFTLQHCDLTTCVTPLASLMQTQRTAAGLRTTGARGRSR